MREDLAYYRPMLEKLKQKTVRALRWSQKYTKTDMLYLAKGGGWLTFGKILQTLAGLGLAIAFANLLPQETYGSYKYIVSLAGIIGLFTLTGLRPAITQAVARGYDGSLQAGAKEMLRWSIGIVIVALGCGIYYYLQGNVEFAVAMIFIAVAYPILKSTELCQNFLEGIKDFKTRSIYLTIWEIVEVGSLVAALMLTDNLLIILAVFFATNTIPPLAFYLRTLWKYQPSDNVDPKTTTYAKHLSVINFIRSGASHIDKVLVFQFLGPLQLAIYSFAILPVTKAKGLLGSIQILALPKFSEKSKSDLKDTLPKKVLLFTGITLVAVVAFVLLVPYLFELLFPQYLESIPYAQAYSLIFLFYPAILFEQALTAKAEERALYKITIGENLAKIVAIAVLLPLFGIWGGIFALLITQVVKATLSTAYFYQMS